MILPSKKLSAVSNDDNLTNNKALCSRLVAGKTLTLPCNTGEDSRVSTCVFIKTRVLGCFARFYHRFVFFLPA